VIRKMGFEWQLRLRMAERGMYATSDLQPLLAERGVHLSREQVFRLVTRPPQRLSMDTLAALCDILECVPNDLIEIKLVQEQVRKAAADGAVGRAAEPAPVRRSTIRRPAETDRSPGRAR
jgi:DNA-binding Xre family transcriptional regulator